MKRKYIISFLFPLFALLTSCVEQQMQMKEDGYVDIEVIQDLSVDIVPVTKAEGEGLPVALKIVDSQGNVDYESEDFTKVNHAIRLETGRYTATASAGTESSAQVSDLPFYSGSVAFEVMPNAVSTVELVCRLTTIKVTAVVADEIRSNFDYTLEISNGKGSAFFEDDIYSDEKEVYFYPTGKLTWTLSLTNKHGEKYVLTESYSSVKPQQHYAFTFSLEAESNEKIGAGEFKIIVDDSLNDPKIHDVTLVIDKSAPTVSGQSSVSKLSGDACVGADYNVNSSLPFSSMVISHSDAAMLEAGLPQNIDIFTETSAVSVLADAGVQTGIFANGYAQQAMDATTTDVRLNFDGLFNSLPVGHYDISLSAANASGKDQVMHLSLDVLPSLNAPAVEPWGEFMYVKTSWVSETCPADIRLQYRLQNSEEWSDFIPSATAGELYLDEAGKTLRAFICGLTGSTTYDVRAVTGKETTEPLSVSTQSVEQLYNMNFDVWEKFKSPNAGGETYYPFLSNASDSEKVWDTANAGTSISVINITPTTPETSDVIAGKAVRMESMYKMKFAAGNIYTGQFEAVDMLKMGAKLYWGVRFTSKPVGLKGWYKYSPKTINYADGNHSSLKGQMDRGQILVSLFANWTSPFLVSTGENKFVDFSESNSDIVAYKPLYTDSTNSEWVDFTLYAGYRKANLRKTPAYIVTTACASYKGDYFTGGEGSVLLVDEFSYIYDPMLLNAEDRAEFFSLFD